MGRPPLRVAWPQIPLGARILSLADTVDQWLAQKSDVFSDQDTAFVRILHTLSGSRFDPKLVELFIEWFQDVFLEILVNYPWMEDSSDLDSRPAFMAGNPDPVTLIYGIIEKKVCFGRIVMLLLSYKCTKKGNLSWLYEPS